MNNRVGIIDYGMGNLKSVANACLALGAKANIVNTPEALSGEDCIILPGVGAFGDGMNNLRKQGWIDALEEEVRVKKKPFLGLCLGMQLLATTSSEHGEHQGFNWIKGIVERIPNLSVRVPHIGWNEVRIVKKEGLYDGLGDKQSFYFVHSYMFKPEDFSVVSGICSHGMDFAASIEIGNIYATQFHPEKSHKIGLAVLKNFLNKA